MLHKQPRVRMIDKYKTGGRTSPITYDRKNPANGYSPIEQSNTRRQAARVKVHGIVVLTDLKNPLVTNIYDISTKGVSFWPTSQEKLARKEFNMDILIFDAQTGFDYFISQLRGRVRYTKKLIRHPVTNALVRRFGLEFIDVNTADRSILKICCSMLFDRCTIHSRML